MRLWALAAFACSAVSIAADPSYNITTVAGSMNVGDGRPATAAQLSSPEGLASDGAGNIYVADAIDHRVRKISPGGVISTVAGTGYPGFSGDGGPAVAAQLNAPYGLAVDAAGSLYIADLGNARVRAVGRDGIIRTIAGGGKQVPEDSNLNPLVVALDAPRNLALDSLGNLYISDFGAHRIFRLSANGTLERIAGLGRAGAMKDSQSVPASSAPLNCPAGIALDASGTIYFADSGNHRIRRIQSGWLDTLPDSGLLSTPSGVALDRNGRLWVADKGSAAVVRLTPIPAANVFASPQVTAPRDVALDSEGNLLIADARPGARYSVGTVRRASGSTLSTIAGDGTYRLPGDGASATDSHLENPSGLALDPNGYLLIADRDNRRIRIVRQGIISALANLSGTPSGLATDTTGAVWAADPTNNRISKITTAGVFTVAGGSAPGYAGDGGLAFQAFLNAPEAVTLDGAGNLYIADTNNHAVRKVTPAGLITTFAGTGVAGYSGDGGPASRATLQFPSGIRADSEGNIYIADTGNNAIRKVSSAGTISTAAGGIEGFGGDGGPATQAQLRSPHGLAADTHGNLFIADTGNHRVRVISSDGTITTIAGTGVAGFSGDGGPAVFAQLDEPVAIATDSIGNVYVADRTANRVRQLTPSGTPSPIAYAQIAALVNAASQLAGPVAPGEIITMYGTDLGPGIPVSGQFGSSGTLSTELGGTQVLFDGVAAPLLYVQYGQLNLIVPYEVAGKSSVELQILGDGVVKARVVVPIASTAPGIFTLAGGVGQAAAQNQNGAANSLSSPAPQGTIITLYATGEGQTDPAGVDGKPAATPWPTPVLNATLAIGGLPADLLFCAGAPGFAGLLQINARIPAGLASGYQSVELKVGSSASQPSVVVAVR